DTSLPLDLETEEHDAPLRKSSRKKSIARKRTLPSPSKPTSDALPFDNDDPEAKFKRYLRQASNDDDKPAELVSLALVSDITTWEIIPTEFGRGKKGMLLSYAMIMISGRSGAGDSIPFLLFMDLTYNDLTTTIQLIQSLLNQFNPAA
nr:hypothetical protein [Tanacetum cinerariifolium]